MRAASRARFEEREARERNEKKGGKKAEAQGGDRNTYLNSLETR